MAIVGHRRLGEPDAVRFVADACERLLTRAKNMGRDVVAVSATAEGADFALQLDAAPFETAPTASTADMGAGAAGGASGGGLFGLSP